MTKSISEALRLLDPKDDSQWTEDGLPRVETVAKLVGDMSITRAQITEADTSFCRDSAEDVSDETEQVQEGPKKVTLKQRIDELEEHLVKLIETENRLNAEIAKARSTLVNLKMKYERQTPQDDTATRMKYIRQQHQMRMERAGLQSKIDQAMSARRGRGSNRPNHGPMKKV